jgi:DNA-binding XRE family transcriptional regulator
MESLYACLFSNGHIKVGRSRNPAGRIGSHCVRVACMGVTLVDSFHVICDWDAAEAEDRLIRRCDQDASARFQNEWFAGLDFASVCDLVRHFAKPQADDDQPANDEVGTNFRNLRKRLILTQAELADLIGCTQGNVGFIERGLQTLMPQMAKRVLRLARERGIQASYEDLYGAI